MKHRTIKTIAALSILAMCSTAACRSTTIVGKKPADFSTNLSFLPSIEVKNRSLNYLLSNFSADQISALDLGEEERIAAYCRMDETDERPMSGIGAMALSFVAAQITDFLIGSAEKKIEELLDTYTKQYANTPVEAAIYEGNPTSLAVRCLRFSRVSGEGTNTRLHLDLIVAIDGDEHSLQIAPLRLHVSDTLADSERSGDDKVTLAFTLGATAYWMHENRGFREKVIDDSILTQDVIIDDNRNVVRIGLDNRTTIYYASFPDLVAVGGRPRQLSDLKFEGDRIKRVPHIPWTSTGSEDHTGLAAFDITVTESGLKPASLELLADFFNANKDELTKQLKDALVTAE